MRYILHVANYREQRVFEFDEYPEAHRRFFKYLRLAQKHQPTGAYLYLGTTGYDEVEGSELMSYNLADGLTINYSANERDVY